MCYWRYNHEIGHTVGLWHEQSREDRDKFIEIIWENVQDGKQPDGTYDPTKDARANFDQHITDGDQIGIYDYCSIMHYGAWFSLNIRIHLTSQQ